MEVIPVLLDALDVGLPVLARVAGAGGLQTLQNRLVLRANLALLAAAQGFAGGAVWSYPETVSPLVDLHDL